MSPRTAITFPGEDHVGDGAGRNVAECATLGRPGAEGDRRAGGEHLFEQAQGRRGGQAGEQPGGRHRLGQGHRGEECTQDLVDQEHVEEEGAGTADRLGQRHVDTAELADPGPQLGREPEGLAVAHHLRVALPLKQRPVGLLQLLLFV